MFQNKTQITKLKEALDAADKRIKALEKEHNAMRAVLESMIEGVITVDNDTKLTSINSSVEKIFGILKNETEGKFFLEAIRNNDIYEIITKVIKTGGFISQELELVWPIQRIFQINASPIFDNDKVNGCLVVIHDITQIRKLEKIRSDFVANVSHELKTPLTSIKGFVETLLEGALEDKENSRHFLEIIQNHASRLDNLINDLLDLSHLESAEIKLEKDPVNLKKLTDEILSCFKSQLKNKSIKTENNIPDNLSITADKNKIEQVLTNLIDNAIKFNQENGFIKIYSQGIDDKINPVRDRIPKVSDVPPCGTVSNGVKIVIEDSGIGIPAKDIPRIFERFYRVDKARSRELGGTGLGLSIVKHIVELHGGSIKVESTEGLGSKFFFSIPK